jgi:hypothetical protein
VIPLFFAIPMAFGATLALAQHLGGKRGLWIAASTLVIAGGTVGIISFSRSYEASPVTGFFLGAGIPLALGALLHGSADLRWFWPVKVVAASLTGALLALPFFLVSCIVAELVPWVRGCFF